MRPSTRLSEALEIRLLREIVGRKVLPGEALPSVAEIAATHQVSQPIVRECMQTLVAAGVISVSHGKRTLVRPAADWNVLSPLVQHAFHAEGRGSELVRDFYEVRRILEVGAVHVAIEQASQDQVQLICDLSDRMNEVAIGSRDVATFLEHDRQFHEAVSSATNNATLAQLIRMLYAANKNEWTRSQAAVGDLEVLAEQHAKIAQAIKAREPGSAGEAVERHISTAVAIEAGRDAQGCCDGS
ncbi:FadR/GntR family transcriptional regulator [Nocardioides sp. LHD-245]|uniref:FadR/GntR family transcriptional regulator n=1 Tax=Nocardioides sp. LHD-245 TaxID=3051387 RepID=UPI0027E0D591|nr:FadR/GntR family transcriptional regulator [Nocardioides sp. LHD-245]